MRHLIQGVLTGILLFMCPNATFPAARSIGDGFTESRMPYEKFYYYCAQGQFPLVQATLSYKTLGKNINVLDLAQYKSTYNSGMTPLMAAIDAGHVPVAQLLIEAGVDVHVKDNHGRTALYFALIKGYVPMVQELISRGASCNEVVSGKYLIHHAVEIGNEDIFNLLFYAGADLYVETADGNRNTVLHLAAVRGFKDMIKTILRKRNLKQRRRASNPMIAGTHVIDVEKKITSEAAEEIRTTKKLSLYAKNKHGQTALHLAVETGYLDIVSLLVDAGCPINVRDSSSKTALHYAAECDAAFTIDYLLSLGADPRVYDSQGYTPLHYAARQGHQEATSLLLRRGASLFDTAVGGKNILHLALQEKRVEYVDWLLQSYQSKRLITMYDEVGYTPLCYAICYGMHLVVCKLLYLFVTKGFYDKHAYALAREIQDSGLIELFQKCYPELVYEADA